jgi:hypothetical protein
MDIMAVQFLDGVLVVALIHSNSLDWLNILAKAVYIASSCQNSTKLPETLNLLSG